MAIKERKPDLLAVMQQAGIDLSGVNRRKSSMLRCPFHADRGRPNLAVWPDQGRWHCFRCDVGGDVFDFVGMLLYGFAWNKREKGMFKEVLRRLNIESIPYQEVLPPPAPRELDPLLIQVLGLASRVYHLALMSPAGKGIRTKLFERGIPTSALRRYRIGYAAPGSLTAVLAGLPPDRWRLAEESGLFHEDREWLQGRIVFPDVNRSGAVLHMIGRTPERRAPLRYLSLPGLPKTIWGLGNIRRKEPVILTESIIDAINLRELGFQGTAVNGTGLTAPLADELRRVPHLAILPQNDEAGQEAVRKWQELLPGARLLGGIPWGKMADGAPQKDLNDLWVTEGKAGAYRIIRQSMAQAGFEMMIS